MNIVPRATTPKSLAEIAAALEAQYSPIFASALARGLAELLTAQIMIETRNGQSMQNNAPGNVSASAKWGGDAWRPPWFEEPGPETSARLRSLHTMMLAGKAPSAFRAYPSLGDGMADYLRTLRRNFPSILKARTPRQLANAIFDSNYTRDVPPAKLAPSLEREVATIRAAGVYSHLVDSAPARGGGGLVAIGSAVAAVVAVVALKRRAS